MFLYFDRIYRSLMYFMKHFCHLVWLRQMGVFHLDFPKAISTPTIFHKLNVVQHFGNKYVIDR